MIFGSVIGSFVTNAAHEFDRGFKQTYFPNEYYERHCGNYSGKNKDK